METKYFVAECYRSASEAHGWEYHLVGMYDNVSAARQAYFSNMGSIIKDSNDFAMCILFDSYGNVPESAYDSTYVAPEPPEPNEGE